MINNMKKAISVILTLAIGVSQISLAFAEENQNATIEIANAEELIAMANAINTGENGGEGIYYILTSDIDLANVEWSEYIGRYNDADTDNIISHPFKGTFDGNGHVIKNYTLSCQFKNATGLFGAIGGEAVIKNLGIENVTASINADWIWTTAGGIAGYVLDNAKITDCYVKNIGFTTGVEFDKSKMSFSNAGGLAGCVNGGAIENCYVIDMRVKEKDGTSLADSRGAIAGFVSAGGAIRNCYTDLYLAVSPIDGVTVDNSYYITEPGWPWKTGSDGLIYYGIQVSDAELKNMAGQLGEAFATDPENMTNNGYPILTWEMDERLQQGEANIVSSTPKNGEEGVIVYNCTVTVTFDRFIDYSTLNNDSVIIEPSIGYCVKNEEVSGNDKIEIKLNRLNKATTYTITFADSIKTVAGGSIAEGNVVSFTTVSDDKPASIENLVKNGDMEDTSNLSAFYLDPNSAMHFSFLSEKELKGENNSVLRLDPGWEHEPVVAKNSIITPGKYYMSAWVKSDKAQRMEMLVYAPPGNNDGWNSEYMNVEKDKWTFISRDIDIEENSVPNEISIRAAGADGDLMIGFCVDEWSIYDVSKAPGTMPVITDCSIENNTSDITTVSPSFDMSFNVPMRQGSLISGIKLLDDKNQEQPVEVEFEYENLFDCKIKCGRLKPGTIYTLDLGGVKSLAGQALADNQLSFRTVEAHGKMASVIKVYPDGNSVGVERSDLPIIMNFDEPIDAETINEISIEPALDIETKMSITNTKQCTVAVDTAKLENGKQYTVTIPQSVKTVDGFGTNPFTYTFTMISNEQILKQINDEADSSAEIKRVITSLYDEFGRKCSVYEYALDKLPDKADELYDLLLNEMPFDTFDTLCSKINACAFKLIINNTSDKEFIKNALTEEDGVLDANTRNLYSSGFGDKEKSDIIDYAIEIKDLTPIEISKKLIEKIICTGFYNAGGADAKRRILLESKSYFTGLNDISTLLKKAEENKFPLKIYSKMSGIPVGSYAEIKDALEKAIKDVEKEASAPGGGRGSGGGGGTGIVPFQPSNNANDENKQNESQSDNVVFSDLDNVKWAQKSILKLYYRNILNGKQDKIFAPNDNITRAEFAKIAVLAMGNTISSGETQFVDIKNHWSCGYVTAAYEMGIIKGITKDIFAPDLPITRQDAAVILDRMANMLEIKTDKVSLGFADYKDISDYAIDSVGRLSYLGVLNGYNDGTFAPKATATRAEIAVVFDKFLFVLESYNQEEKGNGN